MQDFHYLIVKYITSIIDNCAVKVNMNWTFCNLGCLGVHYKFKWVVDGTSRAGATFGLTNYFVTPNWSCVELGCDN